MITQVFFLSSITYLSRVLGYQMRFPNPQYNLLKSNEDPCKSITQVDPQKLVWPDEGTPPWYAEPETKVYNSTVVTDFVNMLKAQIVPGLPSTFGQTFNVFQNASCLLYIHGGGVRDFLLGLSPKDIDVEYSCSPAVLYDACVKSFGSDLCYLDGSYFKVGKKDPSFPYEELEGVNWNGTIFAAPFTKEYTTNALSFDLNGNDIIIDIVGSGVNDTCAKLIRIPVSKSNWWEWMTESVYFADNGLSKLPRFWKLRADPKSYVPADNDTLSFITTNIQQLWKNSTFPVESIFRKFYCSVVRGKVADDGSGCYVNEALTPDTQAKLDAYNAAIENDMGSPWYYSAIVNDNVNKIIVNGSWPAVIYLSNMTMPMGFKITGPNGEYSGISISDVGDVNGDGYDDIIIGAPGALNNTGKSYIIFGKSAGFSDISLSNLQSNQGFSVIGENQGDLSGQALSIGDVNNDGYDDVIIGAPGALNYTGKSYIIFGKSTGFNDISLGHLEANQGFRVIGENQGDMSGQALGIGDVNNDGYDDVIIGASNAFYNAGKSYVIFGKADGFNDINLNILQSGQGFRIVGENQGDYSGWSVAAQDINGDKYTDIIIGAPQQNSILAGKGYIVFGKADGFNDINLSNLHDQGFKIIGETIGNVDDRTGWAISGAGDINNDGYGDIIIGAYRALNETGKSYVIFGKASGFSDINLGLLQSTQGFSITGERPRDFSGWSVSAAGDINNDGYDDIIIGAYCALNVAGKSYVIFGKANGLSNISLSALQPVQGFVVVGENQNDGSGLSVSGAGDINNDGYDDIIIGAPQALSGAGKSYIIFGHSSQPSAPTCKNALYKTDVGTTITVNLSQYINTVNIKLHSLPVLGSLLNDTMPAIINQTYPANWLEYKAASNAGNDYFSYTAITELNVESSFCTTNIIVSSVWPSVINLSNLTMPIGFKITGNGGDANDIGWSVNIGGDINNDGYNDIIIGAPYASSLNRSNNGAVYVIFGKSSGFGDINLDHFNNTIGFRIIGARSPDQIGEPAIIAKDINGDKYDDIVIGAMYSAPLGRREGGTVYVVFGKASGFADIDLLNYNFNSSTGFTVIGGQGYNCGYSLGAADINGDGLGDIIIGSLQYSGYTGQTQIIFGSTSLFSNIDLANGLNMPLGFSITGANGYDWSGWSVSGAGDVNDDGYADIIIGARLASPLNRYQAGISYVVFGKASGFSNINLASLGANAGFKIMGASRGDQNGWSVSSAGDINNDGYNDIITSSVYALTQTGISYVIFGKANSFTDIDLSSLNNSAGFKVIGENSSDWSGWSVSSAGDINADGYDDIIIGAMQGGTLSRPATGTGKSYILFGKADGFQDINLSSLNSNEGFKIIGENWGDDVGFSVGGGDINADGYDDIIIGAPVASSQKGEVYVILGHGSEPPVNPACQNSLFKTDFGTRIALDLSKYVSTGDIRLHTLPVLGNLFNGTVPAVINQTYPANWLQYKAGSNPGNDGFNYTAITELNVESSFCITDIIVNGGWPAVFDLISIDGTNGFVIKGLTPSNALGSALSNAGDINGDGITDVIIESYGEVAQAYVVFGQSTPFSSPFNLNSLNGANGFTIPGISHGGELSTSVSGAGDVNGDGIADIIIGAPWNGPSPHYGQVYVIFGQRTPFAAEFALNTLNGTNGFIINGLAPDTNLGLSVSGARDVNGDGIDDIIAGAFYGSPGGPNHSGQACVIFGSKAAFPALVDCNSLTGSNGFVVNGLALDHYLGWQVALTSDVNGDLKDDILIGAPYESAALAMKGQVYVIFGASSFSSPFNLNSLNGSNGFVINGLAIGDGMGRALNAAGDINNDGIADIVVSAYGTSTAYVIFGKKASFNNPFDLNTLDGSNGFIINGLQSVDNLGYALANAGDINNDNIPDLLVSAPGHNNTGAAYVIFGNQVHGAVLNVLTLNGSNGFSIPGINQGDRTGIAVSGIGDINNDGVADFAIGAPGVSAGAGECYIIFGQGTKPLIPICGNGSFKTNPETKITIDLSEYVNTATIKLHSLPVLGSLLNGTVPAVINQTYAVNLLQYQAGSNAGNDSFNYTAITNLNRESSECITSLTIAPTSNHLRILVINGGGVRGLIPAMILNDIAKNAEKEIPELFDFIIGTSVGGILASAYAAPKALNSTKLNEVKFTSDQVVDLIKNNAGIIFPQDKKTSGIFEAKYPRDGIDNLLQSNFNINGYNLKLVDTLIPVAMVAQNAVSNEAQIWFSCGPQYSQYDLKDAAGATSAAPVYFPAKYTLAYNQETKDCASIDLVNKDGNCYHESLDGGLFANSPTLLTFYLWKRIVQNKTLSQCEEKYKLFSDISKNNKEILLNLAPYKDGIIPQLNLGNNTNVTIVTLGTGYFNEETENKSFDLFLSKIQCYTLASGIISSIIAVGTFSKLLWGCFKHTPSKSMSLEEPLQGLMTNMAASSISKLGSMVSKGIELLTFAASSVVSALSFAGYYYAGKAKDSEDGLVGAIKGDIIDTILKGNEYSDIVIARDVFGAITLNPVFNGTPIDLDAVDTETINRMSKVTQDFIDKNTEMLNKLGDCLNDSTQRKDVCNEVSAYFYDSFRNDISHNIDPLKSLVEIVGIGSNDL